ncbi:MAG: UDP-glucose 4-epimerase GalE, partial [Armatimonadetes bacterium]|nr:UDP-glucose 4-epimerase GalE [Armatimonadota bacterium]
GYIGSHVCKLLRERRIDHVVFDNLERGHQRAAGKSLVFFGDVRDRVSLDRLFSEFDIDLVMHFAAYIEVGESIEKPSQFYRNNVGGTLNLLEAMTRAGLDKLVFSSTAAVYGEPEYTPIDEQHPKNPTSPYGRSKWMVEQMLDDFDHAYGLKSVRLRYFNAAGADPDGRLGEDHRPETHLIPRILMAACGKAERFKLYGTDYDTPDGTCVRDYVHVMDLADAHLRAMDRLTDHGGSDAYNLGNGEGFSVRQVLDVAQKVVGKEIPAVESGRRPGDPAILVASSDKIRSQLGWEPQYADLETIVAHAWRWMSEFPDGYDR